MAFRLPWHEGKTGHQAYLYPQLTASGPPSYFGLVTPLMAPGIMPCDSQSGSLSHTQCLNPPDALFHPAQAFTPTCYSYASSPKSALSNPNAVASQRPLPHPLVNTLVAARSLRWGDGSAIERSNSPASINDVSSIMSTMPVSFSPNASDPNVPAQGAPVYEFNTAIDRLARVIEAKRGIIGAPEQGEEELTGKMTDGGEPESCGGQARWGRFHCHMPGCSRSFVRKETLSRHLQLHTNESPHICPVCCARFSQGVNLRTHVRRHLGDKPYKCPQCPKTFCQQSNISAHLSTHKAKEMRARWVCKLQGCKKTFSSKGNLKYHQNRYHALAINTLHARLAAIQDASMISEEERDIARYIAEVHNLANKGIKGRGAGRVVRLLLPCPSTTGNFVGAGPANVAPSNAIPLLSHGLPYSYPSIAAGPSFFQTYQY